MSRNKVHYLKKLEIISKINDHDLTVRSASLGNSQVLPRDYLNQAEIETVM